MRLLVSLADARGRVGTPLVLVDNEATLRAIYAAIVEHLTAQASRSHGRAKHIANAELALVQAALAGEADR